MEADGWRLCSRDPSHSSRPVATHSPDRASRAGLCVPDTFAHISLHQGFQPEKSPKKECNTYALSRMSLVLESKEDMVSQSNAINHLAVGAHLDCIEAKTTRPQVGTVAVTREVSADPYCLLGNQQVQEITNTSVT